LLAGWLVRAVKVDHDVPRRRLAQDRLVAIDHRLRLVVEEINLRADNAKRLALVEERALLFNRGQRPAVLPQPDPDMPCPGVGHEVAHLPVGPPLPQTLDHVVFEAELLAEAREGLHAVGGIVSAVEGAPHPASGTKPTS